MSPKSKVWHWATYVEYTGWYSYCHVDKPEFDALNEATTRDWKKVTCPDCKAMRSATMMIICECTHKEHGHEDNTGACSRCDCKRFAEK